MKRLLLALMLLRLAALAQPALATDTVYYYYTNTLHSAVLETDAQGNVVEQTTYYAPYGQVLNRSMRDGPGYTGHEEDPATGLNYMQQRYYDPQSGRFVSTDPVMPTDDGGNFNRYEYANDNPYRYTDPDGRQEVAEDELERDGRVEGAAQEIHDANNKIQGSALLDKIHAIDPQYRLIQSGPQGSPQYTDGTVKALQDDLTRVRSKIDRAAFAKERKAYWKNEANNNADKYTPADIAKMTRGRAPTGSDGHPMELHHSNGTPEGGVKPITRTEHRLGDNYKRNHPHLQQEGSQ